MHCLLCNVALPAENNNFYSLFLWLSGSTIACSASGRTRGILVLEPAAPAPVSAGPAAAVPASTSEAWTLHFLAQRTPQELLQARWTCCRLPRYVLHPHLGMGGRPSGVPAERLLNAFTRQPVPPWLEAPSSVSLVNPTPGTSGLYCPESTAVHRRLSRFTCGTKAGRPLSRWPPLSAWTRTRSTRQDGWRRPPTPPACKRTSQKCGTNGALQTCGQTPQPLFAPAPVLLPIALFSCVATARHS